MMPNSKLENSIEKQKQAGFTTHEIIQNLKQEGYKQDEFMPYLANDLHRDTETLTKQLELIEEANKPVPTWRIIVSIVFFILVVARIAIRCNRDY